MASKLSLPIVDNPAQALTQVQNRLDSAFSQRRVDLDYVYDSNGVLTELIVNLADDLPAEEVLAFRRSLLTLQGRVGTAVEVPVGAGGAVMADTEFEFDDMSTLPSGFEGNVATGLGTTSGPTIIHTDGGSGLAHDLSGTPITLDLPIQPGTLLMGLVTGAPQTISDDGNGNLVGTGGSLPGGGTIDYLTGEMTGTTAALTASTFINEQHSKVTALSPERSVRFDSGAAASTAELAYRINKGFGELPADFRLAFNVQFSSDFGLNNNGVTGAQDLTFSVRFEGMLGPNGERDLVVEWAAQSDNDTPPAEWDTPTVPDGLQVPTAALRIDMDSGYHELVFRRADPLDTNVLGISYDGSNEEVFAFTTDLRIPRRIVVSHTWGDDLDKSFDLDNWALSFSLAAPEPLA